MKKFIIGFYRVPGESEIVSVEVLLVGNAQTDYQNLWVALKKKFPKLKPGEAKRTGSTIEVREDSAPVINPYPGMTIRQIFADVPAESAGTGAEAFRTIGTVFFEGQSCDIVLRYYAEKGTAGISLTDRLTRNATRFSNQINASVSVEDLPRLIGEILKDHKDLRVRVQKHAIEKVAVK